MMKMYGYLRASTKEQDATRAMNTLVETAKQLGHTMEYVFTENQSGTKFDRPELWKMLDGCEEGDAILVESIDRLSRLVQEDWERLKAALKERRIKLVVCNLPTTWQVLEPTKAGGFAAVVMDLINDLMVDIMATMARMDYEQRRERQAQGLAKAKAAGKCLGRQVTPEQWGKYRKAKALIEADNKLTLDECFGAARISRATYYRLKKMETAE